MTKQAIKSSDFQTPGMAIYSAAMNLCERKDQIIIDVPGGDYSKATGRNEASKEFLNFFDNPETRGMLIQATLANATNEHGARGIQLCADPLTGDLTWTVFSKYNPNRTPYRPRSMMSDACHHVPHIA